MTNGVNFDVSLLNASQQKKLAKATTEQEKIDIFKKELGNTELTKQEQTSLQTKYDLTEEGIKQIKKMPGGEAFLNQLAYAHLETEGDNATFKGAEKLGEADVKTKLATFLVDANGLKTLDDISKIPAATLTEVGLTADHLTKVLTPRLQQEAGMVKAEFPANPPHQPEKKEVRIVQAEVDGAKSIKVFNDTAAVDPNAPDETLTFDADETGRYVRAPKEEGGAPTYFALRETKDDAGNVTSRQLVDETALVNQTIADVNTLLDNELLAEDMDTIARECADKTIDEKKTYLEGKLQEKQQGAVDGLKAQLKDTYGIEVAADDAELQGKSLEEQIGILNGRVEAQRNKKEAIDAFTAKGAKATIDEGNSKQRLLAKQNWEGRVVVAKGATFDDATGLPSKVYVQLPNNYGFTPAEGAAPRAQYMGLKCVDAANGLYTDARGLRTFTVEVAEGGKITFKENIDEGHDQRIAAQMRKDQAAAAAADAQHQMLVEAVGGTEVADVSSIPWYERNAARESTYVAALETALGTVRPENYNAETMTVTQRRDALEAQYVTTKQVPQLTDKSDAQVAEAITGLETELDGMHDYRNTFAPTGRRNADLIVHQAATDRKAEIVEQNTRFSAAVNGTTDNATLTTALEGLKPENVVKDGDAAKVTYSPDGRTQTIDMTGDDVVVRHNTEGNATGVEIGSNISFTADGRTNKVKIGENTYELVGNAYMVAFGADATGAKNIGDVAAQVATRTEVPVGVSQAEQHVKYRADEADYNQRKEALAAQGVTITAAYDGQQTTVDALVAKENEVKTNNEALTPVQQQVDAAKAAVTNIPAGTAAAEQKSGDTVTGYTIKLADDSQIAVTGTGSNITAITYSGVTFNSNGTIKVDKDNNAETTNDIVNLSYIGNVFTMYKFEDIKKMIDEIINPPAAEE